MKAILPAFHDARDAVKTVGHALGWVRERPQFGEFNYGEKAEYWALVWGTALMAATGLYLWLDPVVQQLLPYWLYEVVRTIHFYEAVLAVSAIVIWHFYFVIFDPAVYPMNYAWLDGKIPEKMMIEERLDYLKRMRREAAEADAREKDAGEKGRPA